MRLLCRGLETLSHQNLKNQHIKRIKRKLYYRMKIDVFIQWTWRRLTVMYNILTPKSTFFFEVKQGEHRWSATFASFNGRSKSTNCWELIKITNSINVMNVFLYRNNKLIKRKARLQEETWTTNHKEKKTKESTYKRI